MMIAVILLAGGIYFISTRHDSTDSTCAWVVPFLLAVSFIGHLMNCVVANSSLL